MGSETMTGKFHWQLDNCKNNPKLNSKWLTNNILKLGGIGYGYAYILLSVVGNYSYIYNEIMCTNGKKFDLPPENKQKYV